LASFGLAWLGWEFQNPWEINIYTFGRISQSVFTKRLLLFPLESIANSELRFGFFLPRVLAEEDVHIIQEVLCVFFVDETWLDISNIYIPMNIYLFPQNRYLFVLRGFFFPAFFASFFQLHFVLIMCASRNQLRSFSFTILSLVPVHIHIFHAPLYMRVGRSGGSKKE